MGKTKQHYSTRTSTTRRAVGIVAPLSPSIRQSEIRESHRTKLVRYVVESLRAKVTGDVVRRGPSTLLPCNADSKAEDHLRKRLSAIGFRNGTTLHRLGDKLWIQFLDRSARKGRRRMDEKASEILALRDQGHSWEETTRIINEKLPPEKRMTREGVRSLARSRK